MYDYFQLLFSTAPKIEHASLEYILLSDSTSNYHTFTNKTDLYLVN